VTTTVFMFPGQGSQYFQMGRGLFEDHDTFRRWMLRLDGIARALLRRSVVETLYAGARGKAEPFDRTLLSHPAIFMVEYSLAQSLIEAGVVPDLVVGASMGSFAAAAVADVLDVEDALAAVIRQAAAFEEACDRGGMTAVLAGPERFGEPFLGGRAELAGVNFSSHFVVSAQAAELDAIEASLRRHEVGYQRLAVSFPFHSRWIDDAAPAFAAFMAGVPRRAPRVPLVCCGQAATLADVPEDHFWSVVRRPVRFRETIQRLEQGGAHRYVDVGPSGTLATFAKYGLPPASPSSVHATLTPFGRDAKSFAAALTSLRH
jgi:acyl transferase domain-containing protein